MMCVLHGKVRVFIRINITVICRGACENDANYFDGHGSVMINLILVITTYSVFFNCIKCKKTFLKESNEKII